jgi:hypothetical protein
MEPERLFLWIAFNVFVLGMLALDLGVFHRKAHTVSINKEASIWSVVCGLSAVLCFVGTKMMLVDIYKIPIGASLSVIGGVLLLSIVALWAVQPKKAGVQSHKPVGAPRSRPSRTSGSVNPAVIGWIALFLVTAYLILATMGLHRRWLDERRIDHRNGLVESNPADAKWPHERN